MPINRQFKIELLNNRGIFKRKVNQIESELQMVDKHAFLLPLEKAIASRLLAKKLWDIIPDESFSYQFDGFEAQTEYGKVLFADIDVAQTVTLHLGWDILAFSCNLEAAWYAYKNIMKLDSVETYNCCIYPEELNWYIIRAGIYNLYPMIIDDKSYRMRERKESFK